MMRWLRYVPPWLLLLLCVLYVISPWDLLPDFLGLPGRLDDLLVLIGTLFYLYSVSKKIPGTDGTGGARSSRRGQRGRQDSRESGGASSREATTGSASPYEVLGVDRGAGLEQIKRRYREKLLQYHPDRVGHLGAEFQEMAEQKTREITEAFQKILKERGDHS